MQLSAVSQNEVPDPSDGLIGAAKEWQRGKPQKDQSFELFVQMMRLLLLVGKLMEMHGLDIDGNPIPPNAERTEIHPPIG